ncbi:DUF2867 domain-containing protein [Gilliamella apicola]|uniref:DUF2867 domain-containing protein n=1 Tax=Gilliamella apicola TaxID=1196095 RepID=UPI0009BE40BF|nr:DUF2867 domain-containing protein [Gilliamella apicola]
MKQKHIQQILAVLPNNITLIDEKIDYLDYQTIAIAKNITALDAYKIMTSHQPKWLEFLFKIRDFLVRLVGIKSIYGFNQLEQEHNNLESLNTLHFFTIIEQTPDKLTLQVKDSHLDVCLCLRIINNSEDSNMLYLIASVNNHNFWGKLYMMPVSVLHPFIVRQLFSNFK